MKCKACDSEIFKSDICNNGCVYCCGHLEPYAETFMTCFCCGLEHRSLTNGLCKDCFKQWQELKNEEREKIIRDSWLRKNTDKQMNIR